MALLDVRSISKRFGRRQVVQQVSISVGAGEIVGLLGANGAGKSTTFRMTVGLLPNDDGKILFNGEDITRMPMYARTRLGMGYLAQEPTIFASLTVAENLQMVIEEYYPRKQRAAVLDKLLAELNLSHLRDSKASGLSGGERRRLEITRSLVIEPQLLFFDEPFAGVDPKSRGDICAVTQDLKSRGISVLITDHYAEGILSLVDRLYVMEAGTIIANGTPEEIVADEHVRRAYLGEDFVFNPASAIPSREETAES